MRKRGSASAIIASSTRLYLGISNPFVGQRRMQTNDLLVAKTASSQFGTSGSSEFPCTSPLVTLPANQRQQAKAVLSFSPGVVHLAMASPGQRKQHCFLHCKNNCTKIPMHYYQGDAKSIRAHELRHYQHCCSQENTRNGSITSASGSQRSYSPQISFGLDELASQPLSKDPSAQSSCR